MSAASHPYVPRCASCHSAAETACKGCYMVIYCNSTCQEAHWPSHQAHCKSPLRKRDWKPKWVKERRQPAFFSPGQTNSQSATEKWLWGNTPSIDFIQLAQNEGSAYAQDLNVLFAASGDLRNIVTAIASLPESYIAKPLIVINDKDFDVVARNVVMLLLALTIPDHQEAAEAILHCWYSALLRPADYEHIQKLQRLVKEVCDNIAGSTSGPPHVEEFTFGPCSIRVSLQKEAWTSLLGFLSLPGGLSDERANEVRRAVTLAPERVDDFHRDLILQQPKHRMCKRRFREDGILVPFGHSRDEFTIPNPTFYQASQWPMPHSADPLGGWFLADVLQTNAGRASNDLYGKLFVHIRTALLSFVHRLSSTGVRFEMHNIDAAELPKTLAPTKFARIETSNICDQYFLGPHQTVRLLGPLLQKPYGNPHATLVTLFMNAVDEAAQNHHDSMSAATIALKDYKTFRGAAQAQHQEPNSTILAVALLLGQDVEKIFAEYAKKLELNKLAQATGMKMKNHHTIVEKWPTRLKLTPGAAGADEEFAAALAASYSSTVRYLEWVHAA